MPAVHFLLACNGQRPEPHRRLLLAYEQAVQCAAQNLSQTECDSRRWAALVRTDLDKLLTSHVHVALSDVPFPNILQSAAFIGDTCDAKIVISLRDPKSWVASRLRNHGEDPICDPSIVMDKSGGWLHDPLDLYTCAEICPTADLRRCFTTQHAVGASLLTSAFNFSQEQLLAKFRAPLVLKLFSGTDVCDEPCVREQLRVFLQQPQTVCASRDCAASISVLPVLPSQPANPVTTSAGKELGFQFYVWTFEALEPIFVRWRQLEVNQSAMWDAILPVPVAEHLVDINIIDALRSHPARTLDPHKASLHVLALPAHASYIWARLADQSSGRNSGHLKGESQQFHWAQMAEVALEVQANPFFQQDAPFLVIMGFFFPELAFGNALLKTLQQGNVILATTDQGYTANIALSERSVVVLYRASAAAEAIAFRQASKTERHFDFTFHGDFSRNDGGIRAHLRKVLLHLAKDARYRISLSSKKLGGKRESAGNWPPSDAADVKDELGHLVNSSMNTYANSTFCLVPSGDTLTSRRLFEALAAGCVPLLVRGLREDSLDSSYLLPFPGSIRWRQITYSLTALQSDSVQCTIRQLKALLAHQTQIRAVQQNGQRVFRAHLSIGRNPMGTADALMQELESKRRILSTPSLNYREETKTQMQQTTNATGSRWLPIDLTLFCVLPNHRLLACVESPWINRLLAAVAGAGKLCPSPSSLGLTSKELAELAANPFWHKASFVQNEQVRSSSSSSHSPHHVERAWHSKPSLTT